MKIALVGPELEENLALRYIDAALREVGHQPHIFDFHAAEQLAEVAAAIVELDPEVVGLSLMFTARSRDFVALAQQLRHLGYSGHITGGGHFASFHAERLLLDYPALDTIVHGEGESAMVELLDRLDDLERVAGVSWRAADGTVHFNGFRPNERDLDARPTPTRPAVLHRYLGYPIASLLAGRGCYANCNFCSINAWHRQNGGPRFRQRAVSAIAGEMAELYHCHGVRIFNFQDDQFFLPGEAANLARLTELARELERQRVDEVALQVKARPDSLTLPVLTQLKQMGLFRVFLGVESNADSGLVTLGRNIVREQNQRALDMLRQVDVHTCFNLLIFDPEAELGGIRQNIAFMREQTYFPLNFCRVEVYAGTEIERRLREQDRLIGDYHGYTYLIDNPRVQQAYEMFREVFTPRNFLVEGMNHQTMRVDYYFHLLRHFHPDLAGSALRKQTKALVAELNTNNAELLEAICDFVDGSRAPSALEVEARTQALSLSRIGFDEAMRPRVEQLLATMRGLSEQARRPRSVSRVVVMAAAGLVASTLSCGSPQDTHMAEMAPQDPCMVPRELSPEETWHLGGFIQERHLAELSRLLRAHGHPGLTVELELTLAEGGRVNDATIPQLPGADAELRQLTQGWQLPVTCAAVARLQLTVPAADGNTVLRPVDPNPIDTHMAEMAPVDPDPIDTHMAEMVPPPPPPPPPPTSSGPLDASQTAQVQARVDQLEPNLAVLASQHGLRVQSAKARVLLHADGRLELLNVTLPAGVGSGAYVNDLSSLLGTGNFSGLGFSGEGSVLLRWTPRAVRPPDTHMAEMAPRDPF